MAYDPNAPTQYESDQPTASTSTPPASGTRYAWQNSANGQALHQQVQSAYQQYLGRQGSQDEIWSHLNWDRAPDANFMNKILTGIQGSEEAKTYSTRSTAPAAAEAPAASTPQNQPSATGSPVTATGQIPPPSAPAAQPAPTFSQYKPPDQSAGNAATMALLQAILTNPQTMGPNVISQLKEQQKQSALRMHQQTQDAADTNAVAHGTLGNGAHAAMAQQGQADLVGQVLDSNRAVDLQALAQNRQDELNALSAAQGVLNGESGRAVQGYNTALQGELAQQSAGLDLQKFLEQQRQFNNTLGYNYSALDQTGQQNLLQWLMNNGAGA